MSNGTYIGAAVKHINNGEIDLVLLDSNAKTVASKTNGSATWNGNTTLGAVLDAIE